MSGTVLATHASADEAALVVQLAAVHAVTSPARREQEFDILVATATELLRDGPLLESELLAGVQTTWPGAGVNAARLDPAIAAACQSGYFARHSDGRVALGRHATDEISAWRDWAREALSQTQAELRDLLVAAGLVVSDSEAGLWMVALKRAIHVGIRASFAAYQGRVQELGPWLTPATLDRAAMLDVVEQWTDDPGRRDLLRSLALDAVDPAKSFGNDLVSHITIGYTLHAFVGRRDNMKGRSAAGMLAGDRAILDTAILLQLIGPDEQARPMLNTIRAAMETGMEVVVPEHYLVELLEVIDRTERDHGPDLINIEGMDLEAVGQLVDDEIVSSFLRSRSRGRYVDWAAFRGAAASLAATLTALGLVVRPANNDRVPDQLDLVQESLRQELATRGSGRGPAQIARDAETMAMARRRRRMKPPEGVLWPSAWIITPDTVMSPTHKRLSPTDRFPITLTPAQWVWLVSSCSKPAELGELAEAAATFMADDTFLSVAARFPIRTAVQLAQALGPDGGGSELDVRLAQLQPRDLLVRQPTFGNTADETASEMANRLVAMRAKRMNESMRIIGVKQDRDRLDAQERAAKAIADAVAERARRADAESKLQISENALSRAVATKDQRITQLEESRRRIITNVGAIAWVGLTVFLFWLGHVPAAVIALLFLYPLADFRDSWIVDPEHPKLLKLVAALVAVIATSVLTPIVASHFGDPALLAPLSSPSVLPTR